MDIVEGESGGGGVLDTMHGRSRMGGGGYFCSC